MITTRSAGTTPQVAYPPPSSIQVRLFLIRGLAAIVWAAAFAIVGASVTTAVTVAAGVLLVLYP